MNPSRLIRDECILAYFPLHDFVELRALEEKWMIFLQLPWHQNIHVIKDYYGEKVGVYFAWLGHYTSFLMLAASIGIFSWFFVAADSNSTIL
jgi:anoctamin-10/anoctamin-7